MSSKKWFILILWSLIVIEVVEGTKKARKVKEKTDPITQAQCDLSCWDVPKLNRTECKSHCKKTLVKPGGCPANATSPGGSEWETACVETCSVDIHCSGVQKCCKHSCGASCRLPANLTSLPGLPSIPTISSIQERKETTRIKWSDQVGDPARKVPGRTLFVVEAQHHIGPKYEKARMGDWQLVHRTPKTQITLKKSLLPGRWYRFRVASVNSAGSRGYSEPTEPFTLRLGPRAPGAPKRLRIARMEARNANITATLKWRPPQSDLPIIRYKVFWSRRVHGIDGQLDSVLVNQMSVPKNDNKLEISGLEPNSMYFLQVQAISQFGEAKLRSEKAAIFLNTTDYDNKTARLSRPHHSKHRITHFKLVKVIWHKNKLKARVAWTPGSHKDDIPQRYFIQWWTNSCSNESKQAEQSKAQLAATTAEEVFELYELNYGCKYSVHINQLPTKPNAPPDAVLAFEMPSCKQFQAKVKNTTIDC